jgi:site-specific recombinase XerD
MLFAIALGSALRTHEIAALNVGDVIHSGEPRGRVQLEHYKGRGKTKKARRGQYVFFGRALRRKIVKFITWKKRRGEPLAPDAPLFVTNRQPFERIARRTIRHTSQKWQRLAGLDRPYNFHAFRHAALTNLYRLKNDVRAVQKIARHADIDMSMIYAHVSDEELARAVDGLPC